MRKYPLFLALCATFFALMQSCNKDDGPDLTANIVGSYTATISDSVVNTSNTVNANETVTISKVDNSHVKVTSSYTLFLDYEAELLESSTGVVLTIPSQQSNGETISGYEISYNGETASGSYNSSTKTFVSIVKSETDTHTVLQGCEATKQ